MGAKYDIECVGCEESELSAWAGSAGSIERRSHLIICPYSLHFFITKIAAESCGSVNAYSPAARAGTGSSVRYPIGRPSVLLSNDWPAQLISFLLSSAGAVNSSSSARAGGSSSIDGGTLTVTSMSPSGQALADPGSSFAITSTRSTVHVCPATRSASVLSVACAQEFFMSADATTSTPAHLEELATSSLHARRPTSEGRRVHFLVRQCGYQQRMTATNEKASALTER